MIKNKFKLILLISAILSVSACNDFNKTDSTDVNQQTITKDDVNVEQKVEKNKSNSIEDEELKKLSDIIIANNPEVSINSIFKINGTDFFTVYIKDIKKAFHTTNNANYFLSYDDNENLILFSKTITPISTIEEYISIHKDFVTNAIDKTDLIKTKFGNGQKSLYVFSDPDCKYCKQLDHTINNTLTDKDNITVYYIMYPLEQLHPDAYNKAAKLLCSDDKDSSWKEWMLNDNLPNVTEENASECMDIVSKQFNYGSLLLFKSTPTLINEHGVIATGAINKEQLKEFIDFK